MEVADIRQAFLRWNQSSLKHIVADYSQEQQAALELLPLLFHLNHRLLPGYSGPDTPAGIFGYVPDKSVINIARQLNRRFNYQQERVLKNAIIDGVYLQQDIIQNRLTIWLIHFEGVKQDQQQELDNKLRRVLLWLRSREIHCDGYLVSAQQLAVITSPQSNQTSVNPALFIDHFYVQARLLAGKYPAWWLVPAHSEQEYKQSLAHIANAMFVSGDEFVDLGCIGVESQQELLLQAIQDIQSVYRSPEICWLRLLLLSARFNSWPAIDSPASRLKQGIVNQLPVAELTAESVYLALIENYMEQPDDRGMQQTMQRLFLMLGQLPDESVSPLVSYIARSMVGDMPLQHRKKLDLPGYLAALQRLFEHMHALFSNMVFKYRLDFKTDSSDELDCLSQAMAAYLSPDDDRITVLNIRDVPDLVIARMIIRYDPYASEDQAWQLIVDVDESKEQLIGRFSNLLSLLGWALLNRIVDQATQVSIDHPSRMVKQIEARQVLEILIQQLDVSKLLDLDAQVFAQQNLAVKTIVFSHLTASVEYQQRMASDATFDPLLYQAEDQLTMTCEQLIFHAWGDVYVRQYTGNLGILRCLCDWSRYGDLQQFRAPGPLLSFGYSSGMSTFWSQRIEQIYDDLLQFFYVQKNTHGRFVVRMGPEYFLVEPESGCLCVNQIGTEKQMLSQLEQSCTDFVSTGVERFAFPDTPLAVICTRNRPAVVQVFFQVISRQCHSWVLDEKGSVWYQQHTWFDRASYMAHWLYLLRNVRSRLKKISYQNRELPGLEVMQLSSNALGDTEFNVLGAEAVKADRGFIDLRVQVDAIDDRDQLSLVCDGRDFSYQQYGDGVLIECVQYIKSCFEKQGQQPVYVTDIDVPLRLYGVAERDQIQVIHFLRYKRNIEARINQLINQY